MHKVNHIFEEHFFWRMFRYAIYHTLHASYVASVKFHTCK